jgi:hypothetical protein
MNVLPDAVKAIADRNFELLKAAPRHPSLHFKSVGQFRSVRVGRNYRALAVASDGDLIWFWIGTHAEYDRLVRG